MPKISLEHITVRYGEHAVLEDFSISVEQGEILGIVGPSGCGKTTVMRVIGGFVKPEEGRVVLDGKVVYDKHEHVNVAPERRNIGIVFQDYAVWPHLSVYDNVAYPLKKHRIPRTEIPERVEAALNQVHMNGYEKYMPSQLSGGQQQRVAIARALTTSDEMLILDEPITNLDAKLREEMLIEIRLMQERLNTTIIYITHDQEAAMQLCNKVVIMGQDGVICQIGDDEEIIKNPASRFVFSFIGVSNFLPVYVDEGKYYLSVGEKIKFSDSKPAGFPDGAGNVVMGIRPMDIVFDDSSAIRGRIVQAVFLGSLYNYFVRLGDKELRVQRSTLDSLDGIVYEEGRNVGLRFVCEKYYEAEEEDLK